MGFTKRAILGRVQSMGIYSTPLSALAILKRQFEAAANTYCRLNHLLVETSDDRREALSGPFPVDGCRSWEEAIGTQGNADQLSFRAKDSHNNKVRIGGVMGIRAIQRSGTFISGNDRPIEVQRHYFVGRDHFKRLAEQSYDLLIQLPSEIINAYPNDWKVYERHFRPFRVRRLDADRDSENSGDEFSLCTYDAILPPGGYPSERWAGYLHWLGWAGEVPGLKAERRTWVGNGNFPWYPSLEEFNQEMGRMPQFSEENFEQMRHYYSVVQNLFLSSALAIDFIETKSSQLLSSHRPSTNTPEPSQANREHPIPLPMVVPEKGEDEAKSQSGSQASESEVATPTETIRTKVFISYSHIDARWLKRLQVHLAPLERDGKVDRWDDSRIRTSQDWKKEIQKAIAQAKVAVLLISADFLASDFIATDELPPLLAAAKDDGAFIMSVILSPCRFNSIPALSKSQAVNPPSKPLISMKQNNREQVWVKLTTDIEDALAGEFPT